MSTNGDPLVPPSRAEVKAKIAALISNDDAREHVANWAAQWVQLADPHVEDPVVWEALVRLSGADLRMSRNAYLHTDSDFIAWLRDLEES